MSGHLVVVDRSGREGKKFLLESGIATIGRGSNCDVRVTCPTVSPHHATIVIHNNQAILRSVHGATLVNGRGVSVWRLRHGDALGVGGRRLKWSALQPEGTVPPQQPALVQKRSRGKANNRRMTSGVNSQNRIKLEIEALHRASMPASSGGKQVAIVQPQRRETGEQNGTPEPRMSPRSHDERRRGSEPHTQASLWIDSRKLSPRKSTPRQTTPLTTKLRKPPASAKKSTPLRLTVLRRAQSAHKPAVMKIQDPTRIDHTKQAALMLMTGHTPKLKLSPKSAKKSPSYVIKKSSPVRKTPNSTGRKSSRGSNNVRVSATPDSANVTRSSRRGTTNQSILEISDTDTRSTASASVAAHYATDSSPTSPVLLSPRKSALKDPSVKSIKKNESIKFDLSNLENYHELDDILVESNSTKQNDDYSISESHHTLRFSDTSPAKSPSPRSISSRSSKIIGKSFGSPLNDTKSPSSRRSLSTRNSQILEKTSGSPLNNTKSLSTTRVLSSRNSQIIEKSLGSPLNDTKSPSPRRSLSTRNSQILEKSSGSSLNDTKSPSPRRSLSSRNSQIIEKSLDSPLDQTQSPSPRRSLSSRSSKIMEKSLGSPLNYTNNITVEQVTLTPGSPSARKSLRGSLIVQKALESSSLHNSTRGSRTRTLIDESGDTNSAFKTKTLSPRKSNQSQNMESYSIVDLVSMDSNETGRTSSVYNSADSVNSSVKFGTPRNSSGRKSKSTIRGSLLSSSTPYVPKVNRSKRSHSSPNISTVKSPNLTRSSVMTRRSKSVTTPENTNQSINDTRLSRLSRCRSRINDTDLLLLSSNLEDTDDTSPKSSRRVTKSDKSNTTSNTTIKSARKTRSINATITLDDSTINEGLVTPENRRSPVEEVRTPVLSIRSLLNSSQSSASSVQSPKTGRRNSKRKTVAVVTQISPKRGRKSAASKSLIIIPAKKSLRLSPNVQSPLPDEEIVTPKSAVKIVQEAVKNKHSTAKKPQSKRSIIDNLNESDIVKQLFNSPVKRKLSQSMTEFSRKQLFDDNIPKKATRHTIALGHKEDSVLNNSDEFTPEAFVSPLSTPGNSPNLTNVKRLIHKKSTGNISGVTAIVRSPRTRKSVKNDLTNVSGINKVFAKSPRNRLSDIRGVKEMFVPSPKNDLRRVSGVKTLFKKQRTPKNDLTDVRGVKSLFKRASPRNDYRNVSGVKETFAKPPRNDLSDVRGIKNIFGRKKRQTDYNNVSGVEDLFNVSDISNKESSSERLFDQLLGNPTVKAVYSKSYAKKSSGAAKKRAAKSLHASIDNISHNVEDWLEQELQKRLHKVDKPNNSKRKSRELEKLATDTVSGSAPVQTSRIRNSTLTKSVANISDGKKSASELYSAHTLPIKKRSIVELSLHKSQNSSQNKSANKSAARHQLPIKKRAVVHSTPVKGRYNMTMNASELGRVSPIIGDKTKDVHETSLTILPEAKTSPKPKGRRAARVQQTVENIPEAINEPSPKPSPKKSRGRLTKASQSRRIIKADETVVSNVKKRRSSIVITKKSPIANPKPTAKSNKSIQPVSPKPVSPKKTRGRKQKSEVQETIKTPKRTTRAKVQKATVVITKPSPQMKPKRETSEVSSVDNKTNSKRSRKDISKELPKTKGKQKKAEVLQESAEVPNRRTRKTVEVKVQSPPARRGKVAEKIQKPEPVASKKRGGKPAIAETKASEPSRKTEPVVEVVEKRRGRRNAEVVEPEPSLKRGRKTVEVPAEPKTRRGQVNVEVEPTTNKRLRKTEPVVLPEPATKRGRKTETKADTNKKAAKKSASPIKELKTRGKKLESQASTQSEPTTRGRRNNQPENIVVATKTTRNNKSDNTKSANKSQSEVVKNTRGRKTKNVEEAKTVAKQDKGKKKVEAKAESPVKGKKKVEAKVESPVKAKPTRGKKAVAVVEEKPLRGNRKRKSDSSPAKENRSQPAKKSRTAEAAPASKRSTRAAQQIEVAPKTGGRQRRR